MASSTVRPLELDANTCFSPTGIKAYPKSFTAYKKSNLASRVKVTVLPSSFKIGGTKKVGQGKKYICNFTPTPTDSSFFGDAMFKKLMDLNPIPLEPPAELLETCSNNLSTNKAKSAKPVSSLSKDLRGIELQPLEGSIIETVTLYPAPTDVEMKLPQPVPCTSRSANAEPMVLDGPQPGPIDYSSSCLLNPDLRFDLENNLGTAADFLTPRHDELYKTLDDVLNDLVRKIEDVMAEVKWLLMEPRTLDTIHKINNLMITQQQSVCALQQILSTYSVRRSDGRADPMMNQ